MVVVTVVIPLIANDALNETINAMVGAEVDVGRESKVGVQVGTDVVDLKVGAEDCIRVGSGVGEEVAVHVREDANPTE